MGWQELATGLVVLAAVLYLASRFRPQKKRIDVPVKALVRKKKKK